MCEKSSLPETKYVQHHTSRDIGPLGNSRNTVYNLNAIYSNEVLSVPPKFQDDEKNSRLSVSSQVDYSVSKNGLPLYTENQKGHLQFNDQIQLAADSPSNTTMTSKDESLDSDFLSISDSSEQFEAPKRNAAVNTFINDVVNRLLSGFRSTTKCQFSQATSGNMEQSTTQAAATGSSTTSGNSGQSRKKRRAAEGDDDNADQGGFPKPPRKRICHNPDKALQRSFACPYLKMDPVKYGNCCAKQLTRIRDVKQHLHRRHTPKRYCLKCLETNFCDEQALKKHADLATCPSNDSTALEGISHEQRDRLSHKSDCKISEEDQWFVIWEILFLRRARPSSVYMDTGLSMELRLFREYFDIHESSVVGEQYESNPVWSGESTAEQRQAFLQMVRARASNRVFEDYRHSTSSLESLRSREQSGDSIQPTQSEAPLSSIADSGIAVDSQFSPRDVSSRRHAPSQLAAVFDNGEPSNWIPPLDEMMEMPQGIRDGLIDFPNEFDAGEFDGSGLELDFSNWPQ